MTSGVDDETSQELSKAFKKTPTLENYVKLRRAHPAVGFEVAVVGGMEDLFYMQHILPSYGIDPALLAGTMDADPDSISKISLLLMEKIIEAKNLTKTGQTHLGRRNLAVPDKLIDWLITCALDALSWNDELSIPRDLIVLIRERLGGANPEYKQASRVHENKMNAALIAGQLKAQGITPTFKILASFFGVAPSTVKRWFDVGEFERETDYWSRMFDEHGGFLDVKNITK